MPRKPKEIEPMSAVEQVLADAQGSDEVICICVNDGQIEVNSSVTYAPDILWALEQAKISTLELGDPFTEQ
jgi:hypothetical protein